MSNLAPSLLVPNAPQVNLIPPEVASRKAAGRARGLVLIALLLFVGFLLAIFYWTSAQQRAAEIDLANAVKAGDELNAQIAAYAEVPLVQAQLANATSARLYAGATEVRWDSLLRRMEAAMPAETKFATVSFSVSSPVAPATVLGGPYLAAGIGQVTFSGVSPTYPDVAALERGLNSVAGLTDTEIPAVSRVVTDDTVNYVFAGVATVTVKALDFRFTDPWFVARDREMAGDYLDALVAGFPIAISFAQANVDAGLPDAATQLADAREAMSVVTDARDAFTSISDVLAIAESNLEIATAAQANGEEGADALLAEAQSAVDILSPAMDQLTSAVLAMWDTSKAWLAADERVVAAEALVAAKKAQLETAKAVLAAATADRTVLQADVDYYTILVGEAEDVLEAEKSAAMAATEAAEAAYEALAPAAAAAEAAVTTANVTVALRPSPDAPAPAVPAPSPSPTASPSPSATQGGDS